MRRQYSSLYYEMRFRGCTAKARDFERIARQEPPENAFVIDDDLFLQPSLFRISRSFSAFDYNTPLPHFSFVNIAAF